MAATPMDSDERASKGPEYESGMPYLRKNQVGMSGIISPAPSPMRVLLIEKRRRVFLLLSLRNEPRRSPAEGAVS